MVRFEDTNSLFGEGPGSSTYANVVCGWCGKEYTDREDDEGEVLNDNDAIGFLDFGDLEILDCCYEKIEQAVLDRIGDIIPWVIRILESKRTELEQKEALVAELRKALS